jgi:hypothetical protein
MAGWISFKEIDRTLLTMLSGSALPESIEGISARNVCREIKPGIEQ